MTTININSEDSLETTSSKLGHIKVTSFNNHTHFKAHLFTGKEPVTLLRIDNKVTPVNSGRAQTESQAIQRLLEGVAKLLNCRVKELHVLLRGGVINESIVDVKAYLSRGTPTNTY